MKLAGHVRRLVWTVHADTVRARVALLPLVTKTVRVLAIVVSGNAQCSAWCNRSTGRCVMIRTQEGRYQSIVQTSPVDRVR